MSRRSRIPVPGSKLPARGAGGSWLFERSPTHFHQGLDIGGLFGGDHPVYRDADSYKKARLAGKLEVVSVTSGVITAFEDQNHEGGDGYGRLIVVKSKVGGRDLWFLYGHLAKHDARLRKGVTVEEGQVIGHVGHSGNAGALNPHLHFEIATDVLPTQKGPDHETTPTIQRRRIDPSKVLEELGPFSAKRAYFVTGGIVTPTVVVANHVAIETSSRGGFFPLGANNIWHGGVHMHASVGSKLVAPFDGKIVAVRLDPNPASAIRAFGSCNFVLMRHELPERLYAAMRAEKGGNADPAFLGPQASGVDEDGEAEPHAHDQHDDDDECCGDSDHVLDKAPQQADPEQPPTPEDPKRVIFSLLMHVGAETFTDVLADKFAWLKSVRVDAGSLAPPPGAQDAKDDFVAHEEDVAEADSHRIGSTVGGGEGKPLDIAWVEKRLVRFDPSYTPVGKEDPALTAAIEAFQAEHVWSEGSSKINGLVKPGKDTDKKLRQTRRALKLDATPAGPKTLDPMFVARAGNLDADGVAEVIAGLDIPVRAGDALWESDRARGFNEAGATTLQDQVHWEIFSEHPIFDDGVDGWGSIDDTNEDLTTDAPQSLIDLIDKPTAASIPFMGKGPDGIVSLAELNAFYSSPASTFLRRRQCRFRAEWGLDLDKTIPALVKTFPNIESFREDLVPYQWWDKAGIGKPHVWHYNPVEFIGIYQQGLDAIAPPPKKDPRFFGDVQIIVTNKQGGRLGRVVVTLTDAKGTKHTAKTKGPDSLGRDGGEVTFFDVAKGTAKLTAHFEHKAQTWDHAESTHEVAAAAAEDAEFVRTTIRLAADVDGDPPPTGKIQAFVRKSGMSHKESVVVEVVDGANVVVASGSTSGGKVTLGGLPFASYKVRCQDGGSDIVPAVVDKKTVRVVKLNRFLPEATLKVRVIHEGAGVEGVEVRASTAPKTLPAVTRIGVTDPFGDVVFSLYEGPYKVSVGKLVKDKKVVAGKLNELIVETKTAPPPTLTGILIVEVPAIANDGEVVQLCEAGLPDFPVLTKAPSDGVAEFVTAPGSYIARYGDAEVTADVTAGVTTNAVMEP